MSFKILMLEKCSNFASVALKLERESGSLLCSHFEMAIELL